MKTKIQSLIRSLAAALLAIAASFAASAAAVSGHPTWSWSSANYGTLTSSDGWSIQRVSYGGGVLNFTFVSGFMPSWQSGFTPTTLDFTNLKDADGADFSGIFAFGNNSYESGATDETKVTKIILPEYITALGNMTFWHFTALTEVEGLEHVKNIGGQVFYKNTKLATLTGNPVLSKLERVGYAAFEGSGLTAIDFSGAPMTVLPERLFADCTNLVTVTLPAGLTSLGEKTFYNCSALSTVNSPSGLSSMGVSCFEGASSLQGTFNSAFLTRIPERAFAGAGAAFVFKAGAALESVGPAAFSNATGLTKVDLTAATKLTAVADGAFYGCSSLTTIDPLLPDTLTSFGASAFEGCSAVSGELKLNGKNYSFAIGESGFSRTFYGWDSITSLVLGTDILNLPDYTFATDGASPQLTYITFSAPDMRELNDNIFTGQKNVKELTLAALHLRTPGQAFAPFTILDTVHWQGAVPYGLTTDPFPNRESGKITINVSGASWSRKTEANGAVAPLLIDNLSSSKPQTGQWIFEGTKASPTKYQNTNNTDPQTLEGTYAVTIGDDVNSSVKIDAVWLTAKGLDPSDKTATENWLKGGAGDYKNWMAYVLGNEPGDKVVITSDAAKDTDTGVTIKLGNVADFRDVQTGKTGRPKADECYVSTKFQLMKWDYQNSEYVPEGTPSESSEFTLPFDACTPAARYTVRIAFTADSKTLFVDAVDAVYFYTGTGQTIPVPGVDPADGVSITYSFDRDGTYSATSPTMTDVGETNIYIKATKSGFADASAEAKLTILQADNSWTTEPSISPDSWKDAPASTDYTLVAVPRFGTDTVEARIDDGAWRLFSEFELDTVKGIHTIEFQVPETKNYRVLEGSTSYSIGTYYTAHSDASGEKSYVKGKYWTINRDGSGAGSTEVAVESNYDYAVLPGGKIRTEVKDAEHPFNGDTLILLGDGITASSTAPTLMLKGADGQPGENHYIRIKHLVVSGAGRLEIGDFTKKFHIGPLSEGGYGRIEFKPGATLFLDGQNGLRNAYLESKITGDANASIRLSKTYVSDKGSNNPADFYFDGDMSEFYGRIAGEDPEIHFYVSIYLNNTFGGSIGRLFTNRDTNGRLHLAPAAVGEQGIPVESGDALAPGSLVLDGDWSESAVGANQRLLVYPAGTQLDVADFTNIASLNPALVTLGDGRVALVVNCNMTALTIEAESPAAVTYDGKEHGLVKLPTVSPDDVGATLAYLAADGETWTEFDELEDLPIFTEAGDHEIQLRAVADGYQTAFETVVVRINKATGKWSPEPSISPMSWTEGGQDSLSVSFGTPDLGSYLVYLYAIEGGVKYYDDGTLPEHLLGLSAGSYTVMFTAESENTNYVALTKEIPITVIAAVPDTPIARPTANNYTYNATERAGVADGEGYTVVNGKMTAVGDYTATVTLATGYCWDSEPAKETLHLPWSIARAAATVTADDKSKKIGDVDPELTATVTGLFGADTVAYTLSRAAGEDVGTYSITPSGNAVQGNYNVSFVPGTFTIKSATPTYYKVGNEGWVSGQVVSSLSSSTAGSQYGWSDSVGGSVLTHTVSSANGYVVPAGTSLSTPNSIGSWTFAGASLDLFGTLKFCADENRGQTLTVNRLTAKGDEATVGGGVRNVVTELKGDIFVEGTLTLSAGQPATGGTQQGLKVSSRITGNGDIKIGLPSEHQYTMYGRLELAGDASTFAGTMSLKSASSIDNMIRLVISGPFGGTLGDFSALTGADQTIYLGAGAINAGGVKVASASSLPTAQIDLTTDAQTLVGRFALLSYPADSAPALDAFTKLANYGTLSYETFGDRKVLTVTYDHPHWSLSGTTLTSSDGTWTFTATVSDSSTTLQLAPYSHTGADDALDMTTLLSDIPEFTGVTKFYLENGKNVCDLREIVTSVIIPDGIEVLGRNTGNGYGIFTGYAKLTDVVILSKSLKQLNTYQRVPFGSEDSKQCIVKRVYLYTDHCGADDRDTQRDINPLQWFSNAKSLTDIYWYGNAPETEIGTGFFAQITKDQVTVHVCPGKGWEDYSCVTWNDATKKTGFLLKGTTREQKIVVDLE